MSNKNSNSNENTSSTELGFQTFFGTIIIIALIPLLINIINLIFFYKEEFKNPKEKSKKNSSETSYFNCNCNACKTRLTTHNKKIHKKNFSKSFYLKIALIILLSYWSYKCFLDIQEEAVKINYKNFDPYNVLGVNYYDEISVIKKAYRKLMTQKHPDKLITLDTTLSQAEMIRKEFIFIVKAYEILTDPEKKENFEKYGDPDGPKSSLHVVLPSFFFNKKFHFPIIIGFLIFIFSIAAYTVLYLKGNDEYDDNGNSRTNQGIYYYNLNENVQLKHIPFIIGLSIEFNSFPLRKAEGEELNGLWEKFKGLIPKIKGEIPFPNKKTITLIYAWLKREKISNETIKTDLFSLQETLLTVFPKMLSFANTVNQAKKFNKKIKTLGYNCTKSLIEFSQCLNQRLWFDSSPYSQLPYIKDIDVVNCNKRLRKDFIPFEDFIKELNEEKQRDFIKKINGELNEDEMNDIIEVCRVLPRYDISCRVYVDGYEEIVVKDIVTFEIVINRRVEGKEEGDVIGFNHSLYLNSVIEEKLVIMLCEDEGKLLEDSQIIIDRWETTHIFRFRPAEVNKKL